MSRPLPRLVIFDLDGTLIDSAPDLHGAVNAMLAEFDRPPFTLEEVRGMIGEGAARLVGQALALRPGDPVDADVAIARFVALYEARATELTRPYPGVEETLTTLGESGVGLAVCTNKPEHSTRLILDALGLTRHFAHIVAGDTTEWRKPDPGILQHVLAAAAVERNQTLMVGDSEIDASAARAAGIPFVLMTYGYRSQPIETIPCLAALARIDFLPTLLDRLR